jgi:ribonuclease HII
MRVAGEGVGRVALPARASTRAACTARTSTPCATRSAASPGPGVFCLSDGFALGKDFPWPLRAVVDGDTKSASIAAASIIAKVTRDRYMRRADALHPGWEFAAHVGYSTPEHRSAIRRIGVSPLHRMSFQSLAYQQLEL